MDKDQKPEQEYEEDGMPVYPLDDKGIPIIERFWYVPPKEVRVAFVDAMRVEIRPRPKDMLDAIVIRWFRDLKRKEDSAKQALEVQPKIPVYAEGIRAKEAEREKHQSDGR